MIKLTIKQAAEILDVCPQRVQELINKKKIQAEKFADVWAIDQQSVLDYKESRDSRAQDGKS